MADYNEYLAELKKARVPLDSDRLYRAIKQRAVARPAAWIRPTALSLVGALAVLLIGFSLFLNIETAGDDTVASYLSDGLTLNGSPLISYVFSE
jgi:hypothetical protein